MSHDDSKPDADSIKMFMGQIPRTFEEEDLRDFLSEYGRLYDIKIIRDKQNGSSKGCAFVTFYTRKDALTAQMALHNLKTMPGLLKPIQMIPADGQTQNVNVEDRRLYLGRLSKNVEEGDIRNAFAPFGEIENIFVIKDMNNPQYCKGCAFVTYARRDSAEEALRKLNGQAVLESSPEPLLVKFSETQKDKMKRMNQNQQHAYNKGGSNSYSDYYNQGNNPYGGVVNQQQSQMMPASGQINPFTQQNQSMLNGLGMMGGVLGMQNQMNQINPANALMQNNLQNVQLQQLLLAALATSPLIQNNSNSLASLLQTGMAGGATNALINSQGYNNANISNNSSNQLQQSQSANSLQNGMGVGTNIIGGANMSSPMQHGHQQQGMTNMGANGVMPNGSTQGSMASGMGAGTNGHMFGTNNQSQQIAAAAAAAFQNQMAAAQVGAMPSMETTILNNMLLGQAQAFGAQSYNGSSYNYQTQNQPVNTRSKGPEGANLFIYHLPIEYRDDDLYNMFKPFGSVVSANVFMDKQKNESKCFGFVSYDNAASADLAIRSMNGFQVGSRRLKVSLKTQSNSKPY